MLQGFWRSSSSYSYAISQHWLTVRRAGRVREAISNHGERGLNSEADERFSIFIRRRLENAQVPPPSSACTIVKYRESTGSGFDFTSKWKVWFKLWLKERYWGFVRIECKLLSAETRMHCGIIEAFLSGWIERVLGFLFDFGNPRIERYDAPIERALDYILPPSCTIPEPRSSNRNP